MKRVLPIILLFAVVVTGCGLIQTNPLDEYSANMLAKYVSYRNQAKINYDSGALTAEQYNQIKLALCKYKAVHNEAFTQYGETKNEFALKGALNPAMAELEKSLDAVYGGVK